MLRKQREVKALEAVSDAFVRALFPASIPGRAGTISTVFPPLAGLKSHTASACKTIWFFSCSLQGTATVIICHRDHLQFSNWQIASSRDQPLWLFEFFPTLTRFPQGKYCPGWNLSVLSFKLNYRDNLATVFST